MKQKQIAEQLKKREQELHNREMDLLQREISIAIQQSSKPTPKKRKGKFKKKLLTKSHQISAPSGRFSIARFLPSFLPTTQVWFLHLLLGLIIGSSFLFFFHFRVCLLGLVPSVPPLLLLPLLLYYSCSTHSSLGLDFGPFLFFSFNLGSLVISSCPFSTPSAAAPPSSLRLNIVLFLVFRFILGSIHYLLSLLSFHSFLPFLPQCPSSRPFPALMWRPV